MLEAVGPDRLDRRQRRQSRLVGRRPQRDHDPARRQVPDEPGAVDRTSVSSRITSGSQVPGLASAPHLLAAVARASPVHHAATPTWLISTASADYSAGRQAAISSTRCTRTGGVLARLRPLRGSRSQNPKAPIGERNERTPAVARVLGVELGGLEPATSWVRFGLASHSNHDDLQGVWSALAEVSPIGIPTDCRRLPGVCPPKRGFGGKCPGPELAASRARRRT